MKKIILAACFVALAAGCKKKLPAPEPVPAPKAVAGEISGAAAPVSTAAATTGGMLAAPGNYIRTTVGQVEKAKAAKALFETTAKEQAKSLDLNDTGGT
jgi:hypothetical protein